MSGQTIRPSRRADARGLTLVLARMKSKIPLVVTFAAGIMLSVGCSAIRPHQVQKRDYRVEISNRNGSEFELKLSLKAPLESNEKYETQLSKMWLAEAAEACGSEFHGQPLTFIQLKKVSGTRNSLKPYGDFSASLAGVVGQVVCVTAG